MIDVFIAIILATTGQILLTRHDLRGLIPYALAILILLYTLWKNERMSRPTDDDVRTTLLPPDQPRYRRMLKLWLMPIASASAVLAFVSASDNTYRWHGVLAWVLAAALFLIAFWERDSKRTPWQNLAPGRDGWRLRWTTVAVIGLLLLGLWFRVLQLAEMPSEMTSDHVEKLLDVHDLVTGQRPIFLVRNTGREPWQFYWTLMLIRLFNLDTKLFALKLGTAVVGLITLPGVFMLGRDLFDRWVGLFGMLFTAVASWPVILSRIGLRFPFSPAVTAWALFFLLRGLRDGRRNDFLMLGVCLGIGMHGYTAFRAMPLAVIACWSLVFFLQPASMAVRRSSLLRNALLTALIATVVFIPLGRFSLEHPEDFWQRSVSRVAGPNQPMPDGPIVTFVKNVANLALMFHWQGDDVWVNTIADEPVLDPLLGGLLMLGLVIAIWRGLRLRDPIPSLLLIAGVILLLPSALSLAFPMENPSVVRTGGAIPALMVTAALPVSLAISRGLRDWPPNWNRGDPGGAIVRNWRAALLILGGLTLAVAATVINYRRYYVDYWNQYQQNALNTTEIASAIHDFVENGGHPANAWIIAWPYWIDTRGVGIELGDPPWNNVILDPEELDAHAEPPADGAAPQENDSKYPRLYVLHPEDTESSRQLRSLFPDGWTSIYTSKQPGRSFVLFHVPPASTQGLLPDQKGMPIYGP